MAVKEGYKTQVIAEGGSGRVSCLSPKDPGEIIKAGPGIMLSSICCGADGLARRTYRGISTLTPNKFTGFTARIEKGLKVQTSPSDLYNMHKLMPGKRDGEGFFL